MKSNVEQLPAYWLWCRKNTVWSIRACKHAGCKPQATKKHAGRPTEPPR